MAYGGYGKNSPPYSGTTEPYKPAPAPRLAPIPAVAYVPTPTPAKAEEHCGNCGKEVESEFLFCPYCKHDVKAARAARQAKQCGCGALRDSNAKHCHKCGARHP